MNREGPLPGGSRARTIVRERSRFRFRASEREAKRGSHARRTQTMRRGSDEARGLRRADWICHELRKPVAALHAYGELLADEISGTLNEAQHDHVRTLLRNAERMERMVGDLHALMEADAGGRVPAPVECDLELLCQEVQDELAPRFRERGVALRLVTCGPLPTSLDAGMFRDALRRLVLEAMRVAPGGSEVRVGVATVDEGAERRAVLQIEDEGPRHGDTAPEVVFDVPCAQPRSGARGESEDQGLDVGLGIGRVLVESLGGKIGVRNRPSGGALTCVELPLRAGAGAATRVAT